MLQARPAAPPTFFRESDMFVWIACRERLRLMLSFFEVERANKAELEAGRVEPP